MLAASALGAVGTVVAALLGSTLAATATADGPAPVLRLQDPELLESSGLTVSARHDGVLWTHADGGSVAQVRAVDTSGETVAVVTLAGIDPYDPEALAPWTSANGTPMLFLADIGDNDADRPDVSVFRIEEPRRLRDQTVRARWYRFTYPDGPHDAEALLAHPRTGRLTVVTKELSGAGLYRAPRRPVTEARGTNRLVRVADAPSVVTDGAYLPDGRIALRTYVSVHVFDRPGHQVATAALPRQPQGESLAADGDRLLVGSEGARSAVYAVPVPGVAQATAATPAATATATPTVARRAGDDEGDDDQGWRTAFRVVRGVVVLVVVVGLVATWVRRRRA